MKEINVENFRGILDRQLHLSRKCCRIVDDLKSAVEDRDYDRLEELISAFSASSIQLNLIEEEREKEFAMLKSAVGLDETKVFYDLLEVIHDPDNSLAALYTELRITVTKMQSSVWIIDSYLRAMTSMLHSVMDKCSMGAGTTYSRDGNGERLKPRGPMVLNFSA